jgi:DNA ligase 1
MAFDILEQDSVDLRDTPLAQRRAELETLVASVHSDFALRISSKIVAEDWNGLAELRATV